MRHWRAQATAPRAAYACAPLTPCWRHREPQAFGVGFLVTFRMPASNIARRVLLIERAGGQLLERSGDYFQQHAIEVLRAPDVRSASSLSKDMRRISAMVINPESVRG